MRRIFFLVASVLAIISIAASVAVASPVSRAMVADLRAGQTGYGLTVFAGSQPDTFGVTILGVQRGARTDGDLILVELSGHGLETSAVAQGMSGSPVYLDDGRLVGAVAFGWSGALRPIAGVTPARDLDLARDRVDEARAEARARRDGLEPAVALGVPARGELVTRLLPSWSPVSADDPDGLPAAWPSTVDLATLLLPMSAAPERGPSQPLGLSLFARGVGQESTLDGAATLVPGGACAVALVSGAAQLGAIGTVSLIEDTRVVCMAHPFMQLGPIDLPLATAEIITMFPSREMSFKMGSAGPVVGRVTHDLRAGLAGDLGQFAPTTAVHIDLDLGEERRTYEFAVARHPDLTPPLVFWCLYNALLAEGDDRSAQQVTYELALDLRGADERALPPVTLRGATGGSGGVAALAADWQAPLALLMGNRHEPVDVVAVTARLAVRRPWRVLTVTGVRTPSLVAPGRPFNVDVLLQERHGGQVRERFELITPANLPAGPLRLAVGSAREFFKFDAARASGLFTDHDLDTTIELLQRPRSLDELVVALVSTRPGVTTAGREYADLPASVRRTLAAGPPELVEATQASYVVRASRRLDALITGTAIQDLKIPSAPTIHLEGDRP